VVPVATPSLGLGPTVLVGVPIAALIVFVPGLLAGGWPLALAALALLAMAAAVGYVLASLLWVGPPSGCSDGRRRTRCSGCSWACSSSRRSA
jgi:hypothetical protein